MFVEYKGSSPSGSCSKLSGKKPWATTSNSLLLLSIILCKSSAIYPRSTKTGAAGPAIRAPVAVVAAVAAAELYKQGIITPSTSCMVKDIKSSLQYISSTSAGDKHVCTEERASLVRAPIDIVLRMPYTSSSESIFALLSRASFSLVSITISLELLASLANSSLSSGEIGVGPTGVIVSVT